MIKRIKDIVAFNLFEVVSSVDVQESDKAMVITIEATSYGQHATRRVLVEKKIHTDKSIIASVEEACRQIHGEFRGQPA